SRGPPHDPTRAHAAPVESRRAASARERVDRGDVVRRPAPFLRVRLLRIRGPPFQAARCETWNHRVVAGKRPQRNARLRGRHIPRSAVYRAMVILARRQHSFPNHPRGAQTDGSVLATSRRMNRGSFLLLLAVACSGVTDTGFSTRNITAWVDSLTAGQPFSRAEAYPAHLAAFCAD